LRHTQTPNLNQLIPAVGSPPQETEHIKITPFPQALELSAFNPNMGSEFDQIPESRDVRFLDERPTPYQDHRREHFQK